MPNIVTFNPSLYASDDEVRLVESALAHAEGIDRLDGLATLAWYLRERESTRAFDLTKQVEALAPLSEITEPERASRLGRCHLTRAHIHALFARFEHAVAEIETAEAMFTDVGQARDLGDARLVRALVAEEQGQAEQVMAELRAAEQFYRDADDALRRDAAIGWQEVVAIDRLRRRPDGARSDIDALEPRGDHVSLRALHYATLGLFWLGEADRAQNAIAFARAHRVSLEAGMLRLAIICATRTSLCFQDLGDETSAGEWCDTAYALARPAGWPSMLATCDNHFGRLLYCSGNFEASREILLRAMGSAGPKRAYTLWFLGCTLIGLGQVEEAGAALALASEAFSQQGAALPECGVLIDRARAMTMAGAPQAALELVGAAQKIAEQHLITSHEILIRETLAEIHIGADLPAPAGMSAPSPVIHFLEDALSVGQARSGWEPSAAMLVKLARAWTAVGETGTAVRYYERSLEATKRESSLRALDRFVASHIRDEIDRVRREAEHQQQLAAAEARRADDLQAALDALHEAQEGLAERTRELERLSLLDPLTGIANRRHFEERAMSEIARVERYGSPLTFVSFDIDHFKQVNDTYGHPGGDLVLREVAAITRRNLRPNDFIARVGGEEFTVLLPSTDMDGAQVIAERMRATLEGLSITVGDELMSVTASFGVATYNRGADRLDDVLLRADVALYSAKRSGRNRVKCDGLSV